MCRSTIFFTLEGGVFLGGRCWLHGQLTSHGRGIDAVHMVPFCPLKRAWNKGHIGNSHFVHYREVLIAKCTVKTLKEGHIGNSCFVPHYS